MAKTIMTLKGKWNDSKEDKKTEKEIAGLWGKWKKKLYINTKV